VSDYKQLTDDIIKQADILTVVSSFIPVTKKGRNYLAVCPFHDDHHPSMTVSPERQNYHCWSCGASGNAASFVKDYLHISFPEAVRKVAEIMGIDDPRLKDAAPIKRDPHLEALHKAIDDLTLFYQHSLATKEGEIAREYLKKRLIPDADVSYYGIGYSPLDGAATIEYLKARGHSVKTISDLGIAEAKLNGMKDRNAGRLVFPLYDQNGHPIGYSARLINQTPSSDAPKYVNSPETPLFHKGDNLYNYHHAKDRVREEKCVYLLEGFMDVMALGRAGIRSAVALMGTALTKEQIELLRRLHAEVRLSLDGDGAGQKGMMAAIPLLRKAQIPFRLVLNPGELRDPDEIYAQDGPEKLRAAMNKLSDPFAFQLEYYASFRRLETPEEREKVVRAFLPELKALPPGLERENMVYKLAKATGYDPSLIAKELTKTRSDEAPGDSFLPLPPSRPEASLSRRKQAERELLHYMLRYRAAGDFFEREVRNFGDECYESIANYIVDYEAERPMEAEISIPLLVGDIEAAEDPRRDELLREIAEIAEERYHPPYSQKALDNCRDAIAEERRKENDEEEFERSLEGAPSNGQAKALEEYARKKRALLERKSRKRKKES